MTKTNVWRTEEEKQEIVQSVDMLRATGQKLTEAYEAVGERFNTTWKNIANIYYRTKKKVDMKPMFSVEFTPVENPAVIDNIMDDFDKLLTIVQTAKNLVAENEKLKEDYDGMAENVTKLKARIRQLEDEQNAYLGLMNKARKIMETV